MVGRCPTLVAGLIAAALSASCVRPTHEPAVGERAASDAFVQAAATAPGAISTPTGVVILTRRRGTGRRPERDGDVTVTYSARLRDGTVIDPGGPAVTLPLSRLIACWSDALPLVHAGARVTLVCPPSRAYGTRGAARVPPDTALVFDVDLLDVPARR